MNIRNHHFFAIAILLATMFSLSVANGQQLRWQFKKGDSFDVSLSQTSKIVSRIDKRTKKIDNSLTLNLLWKVESIDSDGNAVIKQNIEQVQLSLNNPNLGVKGTTVVDTNDPNNKLLILKKGLVSDLLKQVQPLVGLSYDVVMSPRGEIVDVIVPADTLKTLRAIPGSMRLRQLLTKAGLKNVFGQSTFVLPDAESAVDDSWTAKSDIQLPMGTYTRNDIYTVKKTDGDLVDIDLKTEIAKDTSKAPPKDAPEIKLLKFSGSGAMKWNKAKGFLASSEIENSIETDRSFREKNILSTVDSSIQLKINRADGSSSK